MERRALAARQAIVVLGESAIESETAVQHERAEERASAVSGARELGRERRHAIVEPEGGVVVDAVAARPQTGEDRRMRGQRQRRRRERVREADAARGEPIKRW